MKSYIIKELAAKASIKGKQQNWLSTELTDEQRYEIFLRLRNGQSSKAIAQFVQQKWKIRSEVTAHSLSQAITRFKKRIAHFLLTPIQESSLQSNYPDTLRSGLLEGAEGMELIAGQQMERIAQMVVEEKETGVKHQNLSKELQALSQISKCVIKVKEWELIHNYADPVKRKKIERQKEKLDISFNRVMQEIESPEKLIKAMDRFLELANQRAISKVDNPDGTYRLIHPSGKEKKLD